MKEFEFVVAEEYKFERWTNWKSNTCWKFRTVKTLIQGTQIEISSIKRSSTTRTSSIPTMIEEIKPVVLVKYEFEYREKLKSNLFVFGLLGLSGCWCKWKNKDFLIEYSLTSFVLSIEFLIEEIELVLA